MRKSLSVEPLLPLTTDSPVHTPNRTGQQVEEGGISPRHAHSAEGLTFSRDVNRTANSPITVAGPLQRPPLMEYPLSETFLRNKDTSTYHELMAVLYDYLS